MSDTSFRLNPAQSALLVMDCQPAALVGIDDSEAFVARTVVAIDAARRHGAQVGFVSLGFDDSDYRAVPPTNRAFSAVAAAKALTIGTPETALHSAIVAQPNDIHVRKTRVGAFSTTDLDEHLTNLGVTTLILAGIRTSGAVLSTVREAADKDYHIIVLSDCTADSDSTVHDVLLERVFPRQADVLATSELDRLFSEVPAAQ